jgi:glycosyltransferase involved in cell wall biosynthesis
VFVHPGRWPEPFGRTVLEAMQFHTPCIVSNVGAPPWIVDQSGLIFDNGDSEDLATKLKQILIDEGLRSSLQKQCGERIQKFQPDSVVDNIEKKFAYL